MSKRSRSSARRERIRVSHNTSAGYQTAVIRRLRRELSEVKAERDDLKKQVRQYEQHRHMPILADLAETLATLEHVGAYGWPRNDEGHSPQISSGHRGDEKAVRMLIRTEERLKGINSSLEKWLERRQENRRVTA